MGAPPSASGGCGKCLGKNKPHGGLGSVAVSLKEVMKNLKEWSKANFGNVLKEIEILRNQLAEL